MSMDSLHESCCRACGQYYTTGTYPIPPNDGKTRRSSRISHTPSIIMEKERPVSTNNCLCGDCLNTVEMLAVSVSLDDDESERTSVPRSPLKQQHETSNDSSVFVSTEMNNTANCKGIGSCRSCTNTVAFTLETEISSSNLLCIDCLNAAKLVAEPFDIDDDDVKKSTPRSTERNVKDCNIVPPYCGSSSPAKSMSRSGYLASRIVSPEKASRVQSTCSKLCSTCNEREVPEQFMEYCKRCYALSFKSNPSDDKYEKKETISATISGRCRLCTGVVSNESHQYCLKCYTAKQRDDARRIQKELLLKPPPKPARHIPYECMDCGATIHDCSWKTQCPPCFAKIRDSVRKKPKLLRSPLKIGHRRKPTYR